MKRDNYEKLAHLVSSGLLRITYVHGLPRSGTTITAKGLAQINEFAAIEPFLKAMQAREVHGTSANFIAQDFETACGLVLKTVGGTPQKPVSFVLKDVSGIMPLDFFEEWIKLTSSIIVTYKDPYTQYLSQASAWHMLLNKVVCGEDERIDNSDLAHLEKLELSDGHNKRFTFPARNKQRWESLQQELQVMDRIGSSKVFIEGSLMRFNPVASWTGLFNFLGIKQNVSQFLRNPWVSTAAEWDGMHPFHITALSSPSIRPLDSFNVIDPNKLPNDSRKHIQKLGPLYCNLLRRSSNVYKPSLDELVNAPAHGYQKRTFLSLQPAASGFMMHVLTEAGDATKTADPSFPISKERTGGMKAKDGFNIC